MIGTSKVIIKKIEVETLTGKQLRERTAKSKDDERFIVWIQKVDIDVIHAFPQVEGVDCTWSKGRDAP